MSIKKESVVFIVLLLIIGIILGYQFQQYREKNAASAFFNAGQAAAFVTQKNFFDYGVDQKQSGKKP
jgi:regulatory protein YycI of two-component signal transduction system YycFG